MIWIFVLGYVAMMILFCRNFIRWYAKDYGDCLEWDGGDTVLCLFFSTVWPVTFPLFWFMCSGFKFTFTPFKNFYDKESKKIHDRI